MNVFALQAAGIVGTWNTDVGAGLSLLDEGAATLLAGNAKLAEQPISLEVAFACIHPEDRDWVFAWVRHARQAGGPIAAEFRILTSSGEVRWILNRGYLSRDTAGVMRGYGIYIDTTATRQAVSVPPAVTSGDEDPIHQAADHGLRAHAAIRRSGDPYLTVLANAFLMGIGYALARRTKSRSDGGGEAPQARS
jgi:hypothetical protein